MNSKFLKLLFNDDDLIYCGDQFGTSLVTVPKAAEGSFEFFSINPLTVSRSDKNVTRYQNFLFEADTLPLEAQYALIASISFPISTVVYSGGKSLHLIVSLIEPLKLMQPAGSQAAEYKKVWECLATHISHLAGYTENVFDTACKNPSRLSRFPGFTAEGRKCQDLVKIGQLLETAVLNLILTSNAYKPTIRKLQRVQSAANTEEMKLLMPVELISRLKYPSTWAQPGPNGNHGELFKLILWMYDSTGAPAEIITDYLEKITFPKLIRLGYPQEKCYRTLQQALELKGES